MTMNDSSRSMLLDADRTWSAALDVLAGPVGWDEAVARLLAVSEGSPGTLECALDFGARPLTRHPRSTRRYLQALDLLDDALGRLTRP